MYNYIYIVPTEIRIAVIFSYLDSKACCMSMRMVMQVCMCRQFQPFEDLLTSPKFLLRAFCMLYQCLLFLAVAVIGL